MEISSRFQFDQGKRWQMGAFFFPSLGHFALLSATF